MDTGWEHTLKAVRGRGGEGGAHARSSRSAACAATFRGWRRTGAAPSACAAAGAAPSRSWASSTAAPPPSATGRVTSPLGVPWLAFVPGTLRPAVAGVVVVRAASPGASADASIVGASNGASEGSRWAEAVEAHPQHVQQYHRRGFLMLLEKGGQRPSRPRPHPGLRPRRNERRSCGQVGPPLRARANASCRWRPASRYSYDASFSPSRATRVSQGSAISEARFGLHPSEYAFILKLISRNKCSLRRWSPIGSVVFIRHGTSLG